MCVGVEEEKHPERARASMLLLLGERLFGIAPVGDCEDMGFAAIRQLPADSWMLLTLWIPVAWCFARMETLVGRPLPTRAVGDVQSPIIFGWVVFTFMSLASLLQFGRAPVSYVMKFAHVAFELAHLAVLFRLWSWRGHAVTTMALAIFSFSASVSMPCLMMMYMTALGAVLDTCNFLLCLAKFEKSDAFYLVTGAFFWHATYIWAFLVMSYSGIDALVVPLRVYGVWANCLSIDRGIVALDMVAERAEEDDDAEREFDDERTALASGRTPVHTAHVVLFADECELSGTRGKCAFRRTWLGASLAIAAAFAPGVVRLAKRGDRLVLVRAGPWTIAHWSALPGVVPHVRLTSTRGTLIRFVSWATTLYMMEFGMGPGRYPQCFIVAWFAPCFVATALVLLLVLRAREDIRPIQ